MSQKIKVAMADVEEVLRLSSQKIADLTAENVELKTKLAHYEKYAQADEIVEIAEKKGLDISHLVGPTSDRQEKVAAVLEKQADLDVLQNAVQMSTGDLGFATLGGEPGPGGGSSPAEAFADSLMNM